MYYSIFLYVQYLRSVYAQYCTLVSIAFPNYTVICPRNLGMWPSLISQKDCVAISSLRHGKTTGVIIALINSLLMFDSDPELPPNEDPLAIFVSPDSTLAMKAAEVFDEVAEGQRGFVGRLLMKSLGS